MSAIDWLMDGDATIRWQVMRDLLDRPEDEWKAERSKTLETGWVHDILAELQPDHMWKKGRWTDTVWTLLLLLDCGVPLAHPGLADAADKLISRLLPAGENTDPRILKTRQDLCHVGFWLRIGSAFLPGDERLPMLAQTIFDLRLGDGAWNCHIRNFPKTTHSSFHTTFNVLEGLRPAAHTGIVDAEAYRDAEASALEFLLCHHLYRSDKTGEVIDERFTQLTFPSYWHYTVLRGLDFIRLSPEISDPRLEDGIALLKSKQKPNGRWPSEGRIPGVTFFDMEKPGSDSRWNTLRALRVLRARTDAENKLKRQDTK